MSKLTKAQQNDAYLLKMRTKGWDWVFKSELPFPNSTQNCTLILAFNGRQVLIKDKV